MRNKIFWLTGLPCSGKTTIAKELSRQINAEVLDGDDVRQMTYNNDFSIEGRRRNMFNVAETAYRFSKYTPVIVALVSPMKNVRDVIKGIYPNVIEIFVKCDIKECKKRDVKGMYAKAIRGEIKNFTGVDAEYEEPNVMKGKQPGYSTFVDTEILDVDQCVDVILSRHWKFKKHSLFIGRWQPLHDGHKKLFDVVRKEGGNILIGIRDTEIDKDNPYTVEERIFNIEREVPDALIIKLPDIKEVIYGRDVGYGVREIRFNEDVEKISATEIRQNDK